MQKYKEKNKSIEDRYNYFTTEIHFSLPSSLLQFPLLAIHRSHQTSVKTIYLLDCKISLIEKSDTAAFFLKKKTSLEPSILHIVTLSTYQ